VSRVLRKVFSAKSWEVEWKVLHSEEFNKSYFMDSTVGAIKLRTTNWAGVGRGISSAENEFRVWF